MVVETRKQREIRTREDLFLDLAREMVIERGYIGLTMDRIAAATEYSKGTLYQHFCSKEDLLVALLCRSGAQRLELFERAATFRGGSRERMRAIGVASELLAVLYPHHEQVESLLKAASIRAKASKSHLERLQSCETRVLNVCFGITRDAVAQGDLELSPALVLEDITLGLWSLYQGAFSIVSTEIPLASFGFSEPIAALRANAELFLDGCGWNPLSEDSDVEASRVRILREVFPDEAQRAGLI